MPTQNCQYCNTTGEESEFTYDPLGKYWLCPECQAKVDAASTPYTRESVRVEREESAIDDPLEQELDAEYEAKLKAQNEQKIAEKIQRYSQTKDRRVKLGGKLACKEPVSKIEGELYCQLCGGKSITKAGYMFTYDEKIQKWKCGTCGYVFSKYHDNVRIV